MQYLTSVYLILILSNDAFDSLCHIVVKHNIQIRIKNTLKLYIYNTVFNLNCWTNDTNRELTLLMYGRTWSSSIIIIIYINK